MWIDYLEPSRVRGHPPGELGLEVPGREGIQPGLRVPLLGGEAVGDVVQILGVRVLANLDPHLTVGGVLDPFIGVALGIRDRVHAAQVVGVVVVGVQILIVGPCLFDAQAAYDSLAAQVDVLAPAEAGEVFGFTPPGVVVEGFSFPRVFYGSHALGVVEEPDGVRGVLDFLEAVLFVPAEHPAVEGCVVFGVVHQAEAPVGHLYLADLGDVRRLTGAGLPDGDHRFFGEVAVGIIAVVHLPDLRRLAGFVLIVLVVQLVVQVQDAAALRETGLGADFAGDVAQGVVAEVLGVLLPPVVDAGGALGVVSYSSGELIEGVVAVALAGAVAAGNLAPGEHVAHRIEAVGEVLQGDSRAGVPGFEGVHPAALLVVGVGGDVPVAVFQVGSLAVLVVADLLHQDGSGAVAAIGIDADHLSPGVVSVGAAAGVFRRFIELELTTDERRWGPIDYFRAVD